MILALAAVCSAQNSVSGEQETIRLLVQHVKELQEKVAALEARSSISDPKPEEVPPPPPIVSDAAPLPDLLPHEQLGIRWRGFAEVNYKVLNQRRPVLGTFGFVPGSAGNFYTGDFDLFLTSRINDHASVLAEIVFGEGDAQTFGVDLERALVKYDYNDHLKMSFGRYHTGIGYYNTAFHSGK